MRLSSLLLLVVVGCGDDSTPVDAGSDTGSMDDGSMDASVDTAVDAPGIDSGADTSIADAASDSASPPRTIGGDRPADVIVPGDYDPATPAPLLILLHGYTASGFIQNAYFGLTRKVRERGMLMVLPDGTTDLAGNRFWNATPACCNFGGSTVDDVAYITGLIDEMKSFYNVDESRVYLFGHSNGGFMSYRMACDAADEITAIASLAGSTFNDPDRCDPARPISVLQIHGTLDGTIPYTGQLGRYPSAPETVSRFAARAGCDTETDGADRDFDVLPGDETSVIEWSGCTDGLNADLWTINGGSHLPGLSPTATDQVLDWLLSHTL